MNKRTPDCGDWLAIAMFAIIPALTAVYLRHTVAPYLFVHDGQIQIEEAIKFLLDRERKLALILLPGLNPLQLVLQVSLPSPVIIPSALLIALLVWRIPMILGLYLRRKNLQRDVP